MNKINRYNLLGVVAVLMVSFFPACNNDTPDAPEKLALEFESSINNNNGGEQARVINEDGVDKFVNGDEIVVDMWHTYNNADATGTPNFMNRKTMTYEDGSWIYSPKQYWPNNSGEKMSAVAFYLAGAKNYTINDDLSNSLRNPYLEFSESNKLCDILASPMVSLSRVELENGKIPLKFYHIMAKLKVNVRYWQEGVNKPEDWEKIYIESIAFWNNPKKAIFKGFNKEGDGTYTPIWEITEYAKGSGVWVVQNRTLEWGADYTEVGTQYHYPFVCVHSSNHPDNAKLGFELYNENAEGKRDTYGKTYEGNNIEKWFDAEIKGGYTYNIYVTIQPNYDIVLELKKDDVSLGWDNDYSYSVGF